MENQRYRARTKELWIILKPYSLIITAALVLVFFLGLPLPLILLKPPIKEWQDLSAVATWFYSITAFFTFVVVLLAGFIAFAQLKTMQGQIEQSTNASYQASRQSVWNGIFSLAKIIDNYIATHENIVDPPYSKKFSSENTFILLLHHIDFIYLYYINKDFIEEDEWEGMERWLDTVFFRWVESNNELFSDFQMILESGDLYSTFFLKWLKEMYEKRLSKSPTSQPT